MADRSFPPSHYTSPSVSRSVLLATLGANGAAPARRRDPYMIERFPAVSGGVVLVGYDGRGEVMIELRIPAAMYSVRMIEKMRRWLKQHDAAPPPLDLVR